MLKILIEATLIFASKRNTKEALDSYLCKKRMKLGNESSNKESFAHFDKFEQPGSSYNAFLSISNAKVNSTKYDPGVAHKPANHDNAESTKHEVDKFVDTLINIIDNPKNTSFKSDQPKLPIVVEKLVEESSNRPTTIGNMVKVSSSSSSETEKTSFIDYSTILSKNTEKAKKLFKIGVTRFSELNVEKMYSTPIFKDYDYFKKSKEYFENYLENISLPDKYEILSEYKVLSKYQLFSIETINEEKIKLIQKKFPYVSYLSEVTIFLEKNFLFKLENIYGFVIRPEIKNLKNLFDLTNPDNNLEDLKSFFSKYICSSYIQKYFSKEVEEQWDHDKCYQKVSDAVIQFNCFYSKYAKSIPSMYSEDFSSYSEKIKPFFLCEDKWETIERFEIWFTGLFNNPTNSLLFLVFPRLEDFLEQISDCKNLCYVYGRYHFFLSLIVLKFNFLLPRLKYEFKKSDKNSEFLITNSNFFNLFFLEVSCMMCVFATTVLQHKFKVEEMFVQAFISFIRIHIPSITKCLKFNEFIPRYPISQKCKIVSIDFEPIKANKQPQSNAFNTISERGIKTINKNLLKCCKDEINEIENPKNHYEMHLFHERFLNTQNDYAKKITEAFRKYFSATNNQ